MLQELIYKLHVQRYLPKRRLIMSCLWDTEELLHRDTVTRANNNDSFMLFACGFKSKSGSLAGVLVAGVRKDKGDYIIYRLNFGLFKKPLDLFVKRVGIGRIPAPCECRPNNSLGRLRRFLFFGLYRFFFNGRWIFFTCCYEKSAKDKDKQNTQPPRILFIAGFVQMLFHFNRSIYLVCECPAKALRNRDIF